MERVERGSAVPLVAMALAVAVLIVLGLLALAGRAVARAEAQATADAAALAGVVEGHGGALDVAKRNGAVLTGYREDGPVVIVEVTLRGATAEAAAARAIGQPDLDPRIPSG